MTEVVGRYGEHAWKVRVAKAPQDGKANDELVRFLAKLFAISRRDVTVVTGTSSRDKIVELSGIDEQHALGVMTRASGTVG